VQVHQVSVSIYTRLHVLKIFVEKETKHWRMGVQVTLDSSLESA
jgi:hypothetical protein